MGGYKRAKNQRKILVIANVLFKEGYEVAIPAGLKRIRGQWKNQKPTCFE
jgi:uncharacterized protein YdaT